MMKLKHKLVYASSYKGLRVTERVYSTRMTILLGHLYPLFPRDSWPTEVRMSHSQQQKYTSRTCSMLVQLGLSFFCNVLFDRIECETKR